MDYKTVPLSKLKEEGFKVFIDFSKLHCDVFTYLTLRNEDNNKLFVPYSDDKMVSYITDHLEINFNLVITKETNTNKNLIEIDNFNNDFIKEKTQYIYKNFETILNNYKNNQKFSLFPSVRAKEKEKKDKIPVLEQLISYYKSDDYLNLINKRITETINTLNDITFKIIENDIKINDTIYSAIINHPLSEQKNFLSIEENKVVKVESKDVNITFVVDKKGNFNKSFINMHNVLNQFVELDNNKFSFDCCLNEKEQVIIKNDYSNLYQFKDKKELSKWLLEKREVFNNNIEKYL